MALDRPKWIADLSRSFKRHRLGRAGWSIEIKGERLRVVSSDLPPRPDEPPDSPPKRRAFTLTATPGPATASAALAEACKLFDLVMAGSWQWPDAQAAPELSNPNRLGAAAIESLIAALRGELVGEKIGLSTWNRTYLPYLAGLTKTAEGHYWSEDGKLLEETLRNWEPNSRSRQMAHDRIRRLWKLAKWEWPEKIAAMRGNGKAAVSPHGVRAFTDKELEELRARIERSYRLTPADLVAWDCLICFGLRPAELKGLVLSNKNNYFSATVSHQKKSSKGLSGARIVPAIPPPGWAADCDGLLERWQKHGLPLSVVNHPHSAGGALSQQLDRIQKSKAVEMPLDAELTSYGCRHAFALRLGIDLGLSVRESAELMGHSPQVHLSTYGRRIDEPKLQEKIKLLLKDR